MRVVSDDEEDEEPHYRIILQLGLKNHGFR